MKAIAVDHLRCCQCSFSAVDAVTVYSVLAIRCQCRCRSGTRPPSLNQGYASGREEKPSHTLGLNYPHLGGVTLSVPVAITGTAGQLEFSSTSP